MLVGNVIKAMLPSEFAKIAEYEAYRHLESQKKGARHDPSFAGSISPSRNLGEVGLKLGIRHTHLSFVFLVTNHSFITIAK